MDLATPYYRSVTKKEGKHQYQLFFRYLCSNKTLRTGMESAKKYLLGMTLGELKEVAKSLGMPAFTGGQIAKRLRTQHMESIDEMTNISKANREKLAAECAVGCKKPIDAQHSKDGTIKYLSPADSGKFVKTVYTPDKDHAILCISSQVGYKMNCLFCQTGRQGSEGSFSATDIPNRIYSLPEHDGLTNIIFMGRGEPMDDLDNVLRTTEIMTADFGYGWSPKRITISSVGVKGKLGRSLDESDHHVAISMHTPLHEQRSGLMPVEKGMSTDSTIELLNNYSFSHQRRLSFRYIIFKGFSDGEEHAKAIIQLLKGLDYRMNLVRFHPIPNIPLRGADGHRMEKFRNYLAQYGAFITTRASRGQDIFAACGLLSTAKKIEEERGRGKK